MLIYIPAIPIAQPRHKVTTVGGRGRAFIPAKHAVHDFKATVRKCWGEACSDPPSDCPLSLSVVFVLPRPDAMRWKTKSMPRVPHTKKPDVDNLLKSLLDALSGLAWVDDSRISSLMASKFIASADEAPHIEVVLRKITD